MSEREESINGLSSRHIAYISYSAVLRGTRSSGSNLWQAADRCRLD